MAFIYKVCGAAEWDEAARVGRYDGSSDDRRDGFIHFSTAAQLPGTLARHFAGRDDLLLIVIDAGSLGEALKWEPSRGGDLFPHLYGALPVSAALWTKPIERDGDGRHRLPAVISGGPIAMRKAGLSDIYRAYIACLNGQDWAKLGQFVADEVSHNGRPFGLAGYRAMLEKDFSEIPDLHFNIELLMSDPPYIASRLRFDCRPKGTFLGLAVNGKRVSFTENVFYEFRGEKIAQVWSIVDKAAIEAQL